MRSSASESGPRPAAHGYRPPGDAGDNWSGGQALRGHVWQPAGGIRYLQEVRDGRQCCCIPTEDAHVYIMVNRGEMPCRGEKL